MTALLLLLAEAAAENGAEAGHGPAEVLMHHVVDTTWFGFPSKHLAFFVIAGAVVLGAMRLAIAGYKKGRVPTGFASFVEMRGRSSGSFDSVITRDDRPVNSSTCSVIVAPSTMSPNFTVPLVSARIGFAKGSHSISISPAATCWPSTARTWAP